LIFPSFVISRRSVSGYPGSIAPKLSEYKSGTINAPNPFPDRVTFLSI